MVTIEHDEFNHHYEMKNDHEVVCELDLFEEETFDGDYKYWLNGIYTKVGHELNGYTQTLIEKAIDDYGEIYISYATAYEHKTNNDTTARELTEDGAKLVSRLKKKGTLKDNWFVNPFGGYDDSLD
jgi:hypothetical protein